MSDFDTIQYIKSNKDALKSYDFDSLYYGLNPKYRGELTTLFTNMGINPLNYLNGIIPFQYAKETKITEVEIPRNIRIIDEDAFLSCSFLKNVKILGRVTDIKYGAFSFCTSLKEIDLGDYVEYIEEKAFAGCRNLKSIAIPDTLKYLGKDIFDMDDNLKDIYYSGTEEEWNNIEIHPNNHWPENINVHCINGSISL